MKFSLIMLALLCVVFSGCFDNKGKPEEVPTVSSLQDLSKTNRAEVVRLYLRASSVPIVDSDLTGLTSLKVLDLSELKMKKIPSNVFSISSLKQLYFAYNDLEAIPSEIANLKELDYLNLDGNKLKV